MIFCFPSQTNRSAWNTSLPYVAVIYKKRLWVFLVAFLQKLEVIDIVSFKKKSVLQKSESSVVRMRFHYAAGKLTMNSRLQVLLLSVVLAAA